jgi:predicted transcriptional regulator
MTELAKRIHDIAERLDPERQRALLDFAESIATPQRFFDRMSAREREELENALEEANRGEGLTQGELDARLDAIVAPPGKE